MAYSGSSSRRTRVRRTRTWQKRARRQRIVPNRSLYPSISRPLYSPLPAQFKVSLKLVEYYSKTLPGTTLSAAGEFYCCIRPFSNAGGFNQHPAGFISLMRLYSRSFVDMVQAKFKFQSISNYSTGDEEVESPLAVDVVGLVIPFSDIPGNATVLSSSFERLAAMPQAQLRLLGSPDGGHDQCGLYFTVDTKKYLGITSSDNELSYSSTVDPTTGAVTLTSPLGVTDGETPYIYIGLRNNALIYRTSRVLIRNELTYHITFSSLHTAALQESQS